MTLMFTDYLSSNIAPRARTVSRQILTLALLLISTSLPATSLPNRPVASINLQRYMGQWHEIAHVPLYFQRKCIGPVTSTSVIASSGEIKLHATCATRGGAKTVDLLATSKPAQPAAFGIRFAWLSWIHHAWFEYWVIDIDPNYQWAVIGGPGAKHLWILAREQRMNFALYQQLVERARERGYPVDELVVMAPLDND